LTQFPNHFPRSTVNRPRYLIFDTEFQTDANVLAAVKLTPDAEAIWNVKALDEHGAITKGIELLQPVFRICPWSFQTASTEVDAERNRQEQALFARVARHRTDGREDLLKQQLP